MINRIRKTVNIIFTWNFALERRSSTSVAIIPKQRLVFSQSEIIRFAVLILMSCRDIRHLQENIPGVVVISTIRISVGVVLDWKRQWTIRQTKNHLCEPLSIFLPTTQTLLKETHVISIGGGRRGVVLFLLLLWRL